MNFVHDLSICDVDIKTYYDDRNTAINKIRLVAGSFDKGTVCIWKDMSFKQEQYLSLFYEAPPHAAGSLLPSASADGQINAPALPDSSVGFNPFDI